MPKHLVYEKPIRIHFGHCDPAGIVYHPQYYVILNELMEDFLGDVMGVGFIEIRKYGVGFPVAGIRTDFAAPSRPGDRCIGRCWIERVGTSSIRFAFTITSEETEELRLRCVETCVCVKQNGAGELVAQSIPEALRAKMAPYVKAEDEPALELRA